MHRNALLLPTLVFLACATAATTTMAITAEADVWRLNYNKPKTTTQARAHHGTEPPTPKGDTTTTTKLGHR